MAALVFEVDCVPRRLFVCESSDPPRFDEPPELRFSRREERVRVPNFFRDDLRGERLAQALYDVTRHVYKETRRPPRRIDVGRFTFLEFLAHSANRLEERGAAVRVHLDEPVDFLDTTIYVAPGPDHFIRGVPAQSWTLAHGTPDSFYLAPENVAIAAQEAIARALKSIPPRG